MGQKTYVVELYENYSSYDDDAYVSQWNTREEADKRFYKEVKAMKRGNEYVNIKLAVISPEGRRTVLRDSNPNTGRLIRR